MTRRIPPRLRAPIRIAAMGAALVAVAVATHGWGRPVHLVLVPFVLLVALGYYAWGGRDSSDRGRARPSDIPTGPFNHS
jgi:peptidoglycan/LPS O-acetylase OafA/YrhL